MLIRLTQHATRCCVDTWVAENQVTFPAVRCSPGASYRLFREDDASIHALSRIWWPNGSWCPKRGSSVVGRLATPDPRCCGPLRQPDKHIPSL